MEKHIYKQALPYVDELMISRIPGKHEGETYFPSFGRYNFSIRKRNTNGNICLTKSIKRMMIYEKNNFSCLKMYF